jgi:hypothetical protein
VTSTEYFAISFSSAGPVASLVVVLMSSVPSPTWGLYVLHSIPESPYRVQPR